MKLAIVMVQANGVYNGPDYSKRIAVPFAEMAKDVETGEMTVSAVEEVKGYGITERISSIAKGSATADELSKFFSEGPIKFASSSSDGNHFSIPKSDNTSTYGDFQMREYCPQFEFYISKEAAKLITLKCGVEFIALQRSHWNYGYIDNPQQFIEILESVSKKACPHKKDAAESEDDLKNKASAVTVKDMSDYITEYYHLNKMFSHMSLSVSIGKCVILSYTFESNGIDISTACKNSIISMKKQFENVDILNKQGLLSVSKEDFDQQAESIITSKAMSFSVDGGSN